MVKRAIVTGATGVVGTALVKELIDKSIEVLVFCRKGSEKSKRIPAHPLVTIKYVSLEQLAEIENDTGKYYDVFYHFAWDGTIGLSRNDMVLQAQNVKYAIEAVDCANRFGCKKFIGAGSQAEYGRFEGELKPDTPAFPETGYGMAKLCAGQMTRERAHQLGMEHNWVRILSVYGPNDGEQSMVMSMISKLKNGEIPRVTKGEQLWDYLYSSDAAKAFRLVGEKGIDGKIYILGSGKVKRLAEYIESIRKVVNSKGKVSIGAVPYSEKQVMYLCADISELEHDTGWKPEVIFEEGIAKICSMIP